MEKNVEYIQNEFLKFLDFTVQPQKIAKTIKRVKSNSTTSTLKVDEKAKSKGIPLDNLYYKHKKEKEIKFRKELEREIEKEEEKKNQQQKSKSITAKSKLVIESDLYDRTLVWVNKREAKRQQRYLEQETEKLKECSFSPMIKPRKMTKEDYFSFSNISKNESNKEIKSGPKGSYMKIHKKKLNKIKKTSGDIKRSEVSNYSKAIEDKADKYRKEINFSKLTKELNDILDDA